MRVAEFRNDAQQAKPFQAGLYVLSHTLLLSVFGRCAPRHPATFNAGLKRKMLAKLSLLKRNKMGRASRARAGAKGEIR